MDKPRKLILPLKPCDANSLCIGQEVSLSGPVYTLRDAGHIRLLETLHTTGSLPYNLDGQTLFYAGPSPAAAGRALGSIGPTTASRMDFATPELMDAGIVACIGKGDRSDEVIAACKRTGAIYFASVGGIAALLATHVQSASVIAWDDLGTEALRLLILDNFPCFVAIDTKGNDLYQSVVRQDKGTSTNSGYLPQHS